MKCECGVRATVVEGGCGRQRQSCWCRRSCLLLFLLLSWLFVDCCILGEQWWRAVRAARSSTLLRWFPRPLWLWCSSSACKRSYSPLWATARRRSACTGTPPIPCKWLRLFLVVFGVDFSFVTWLSPRPWERTEDSFSRFTLASACDRPQPRANTWKTHWHACQTRSEASARSANRFPAASRGFWVTTLRFRRSFYREEAAVSCLPKLQGRIATPRHALMRSRNGPSRGDRFDVDVDVDSVQIVGDKSEETAISSRTTGNCSRRDRSISFVLTINAWTLANCLLKFVTSVSISLSRTK